MNTGNVANYKTKAADELLIYVTNYHEAHFNAAKELGAFSDHKGDDLVREYREIQEQRILKIINRNLKNKEVVAIVSELLPCFPL